MMTQPVSTELDTRFSGAEAKPKPWEDAQQALTDARIYWITTVRHDLRPHVTPLIGLFIDDAFYFCTGPGEQKAKNIVDNSNCAVVTGSNTYGEGLDIVVEGNAERVVEEARLLELAQDFVSKYGADWRFEVRDSAFHHEGGEAWVYEVAPNKVLGFEKGDPPGQTRWQFEPRSS
jgi:nitroimidazol reductase NimA-like FMN-containing flavoprotein (pyridoxamine 5'-phosphate oxidase superfamily)